MKNIAFIIPSLCGGGAERVVATLSLNSCEEYNIYIITYMKKDFEYPHKGEVINLNLSGSNDWKYKIINTIKRIYKVYKIKKKYKIDMTISFLDNPNIINILSRYKDKVIISIRNQKSKELQGKKIFLSKFLTKKLYNKADKIVALSEGVKEDLFQNFNINSEKLEVIYNPLDINFINSLKNEEIDEKYKDIFNGKNYNIITSGRLNYQKGQWYLLRAFKKVTEEISNINLIILGEGELEDKLKLMVRDLNIQDRVYFIGFQSNPFKFINKCDLFILTSLFEGFGNVITEAMACGTVVIASDCKSGPKEILNPSNNKAEIKDMYLGDYGILIPEFDGKEDWNKDNLTKEEEILARTIIKLLKDNNLRKEYENKLINRVSDFNPKNIVKEWYKL